VYEGEGAEVEIAPDSASCLALIDAQARAYDTIVVDGRVDPSSGLDLCRSIRAATPGAGVRLVLVTDLEIGELSGGGPVPFDVRVAKPVHRRVLLRAAGLTPAGPAARVLLAEDNAVNTLLAVTVLEAMGCDVHCVTNGIDAVAAARDGGYDLILMDVHMPELDGLKATVQIRASGSGSWRTPIVAMTADASARDQDICLAAGMDDFVSKPINIDRFGEVVADWIDRGEAGRSDGSPADSLRRA
jgi:CheY-like chemotaxis protein